jgi:hypothetical protein
LELAGVIKINLDPRRIAERCLQDAMLESLPGFWESRALDFDLAHPQEMPLPIGATAEAVACASSAAQAAVACRRAAYLLKCNGLPSYIGEEITNVIEEIFGVDS